MACLPPNSQTKTDDLSKSAKPWLLTSQTSNYAGTPYSHSHIVIANGIFVSLIVRLNLISCHCRLFNFQDFINYIPSLIWLESSSPDFYRDFYSSILVMIRLLEQSKIFVSEGLAGLDFGI